MERMKQSVAKTIVQLMIRDTTLAKPLELGTSSIMKNIAHTFFVFWRKKKSRMCASDIITANNFCHLTTPH